MKRITSLIIFFMVSLTVLIMFPVVALSEPVGTFTYIKGRVDITAPGMKAVPAHKGDDVNVGDIIRTKSNSKAEIALIDGSTLRFAQKSRVKINEYMVEKKQARGILKLFRGKIQNIVKTAGKTFGRRRINSYEVHTPTAVCGVRGTNFFVFHQANISGAIFKKGSGYGYSVNRPDVVKTIKAGQAMIVISPDQPPVIKPATDLEIEQLIEDTAPSEEEEEAEEEKEEKDEAVEEEAEAEKETAEEAPAEEEEVAEEDAPVEEGEVAEEAPAEEIETAEEAGPEPEEAEEAYVEESVTEEIPAEEAAPGQEEAAEAVEAPLPAAEEQVVSSEPAPEPAPTAPEPAPEPSVEPDAGFISESFVDVDLGLSSGDIADTLAVETVTVDTALETPEPYIPPETPAEGITILSSDLSTSSFPFLTDGTLSSSINDTTNTGTVQISGTADALPVDPWSGQISGSMSDESAFSGYFMGVSGTWKGLISSIYVTGSGAGYITGSLSGAYDSDTHALSGSGPVTRTSILGNTTITPDTLDSYLEVLGTVDESGASGYPIPVFSSITTGSSISPAEDVVDGELIGITTTNGGKLGVWAVATSEGVYSNEGNLPAWSGMYGQCDYYSSGYLGSVSGTDDMNGHVSINGGLTYMDYEFLGNITLDYRGVYDAGGVYQSVGSGTYTLDPLVFSGVWGYGCVSLYYNDSGNMLKAGEEYGLIGGLSAPWDGPAEFLAMGKYFYEDGCEGKEHYLWNTPFYAFVDTSTEGETGEFIGFTGGIWGNDTMEGATVALYLKMDSENEFVTAGYTKGDISGLYYPDLEMWMAEGALTPSDMQISFDYDSIDEGCGYINSRLSGNFDESAGSIWGQSNEEDGYAIYIADYNTETTETGPLCGIYDLKLGDGNTYNGKPSGDTTWSARVGGNIDFYDSSVSYWLADVTGDWTGEGEITGSLAGTFLTSTHIGSMEGSFYGINAVEEGESGTWIGESLGTLTGDPLAFSSSFGGNTYRALGGTFYEGEFERRTASGDPYYDAYYGYEYFISNEDSVLQYGEKWQDCYVSDTTDGNVYFPDGTHVSITDDDFLSFTKDSWTVGDYDSAFFSDPPADGGTWDRHWYGEWDSNCLATSGTFSGIMGGTGDLWNATDSNPAGISLMGMYKPTDGNYDKPSIFGLGIQSSDITTGAYAGYLSGITDGMNGNIYAVYIDPSQNAGILKGGFSGSVYPDLEMWNASGTVYPVEMTTSIGVPSGTLSENLDNGIMVGWVSGDFGASGSGLSSKLGWGETLSIRGEDWGVYRLSFGYDNYFNNPGESSTWSARAGGYAEFGTHESNEATEPWKPDTGIWLASSTTESLDSGVLTAGLSGDFLTHTKFGQLAGDIIGTYDDANNGWQAVASGYWESSQDLKFNGVLRGGDLNLKRIVEQYHGHWDDGAVGGSYYDYKYYTGVEAGWSCEYDANNNVETHVNYHQDGTTEKWINSNGTLSYSEDTYTGSVYENVKNGPGGVIVEPYEYPSYYLGNNGWLSGYMGSLDDLWTAFAGAGANIRFIGEYEEGWYNEALPSIFSVGIESYNPYDDSCTIWNQGDNSQNGAYYGYMGGRTLGNYTVEGGMLALYLDGSGNMGFLDGSFDGNLYPDAEMWDGAGEIYPIELVQTTGLDASDLHSDADGLVSEIHLKGPAEFHGEFFNASNGLFGGDIYWKYGASKLAAVNTTNTLEIGGQFYNQYFSVASTIHGGTYAGALDHWYLPFFFGYGTTKTHGYLLSFSDAAQTDGSWSDNMISGKGVGAWVNLEDVVTGVCGADLKGTFNPVNTTWQTAAMWAGMDTRTFLSMTATTAGIEKLAQLNIPCIEVGKTDLAGSNGNLSVNMKDTTFFAYSTGACPRIWATGDVSGTYTADPSVGTSVPLIGTGGNINANFDVQKWDTNKWAASVNGSGTVADNIINMTGSAAGTYGGSTFSGTGAGIAIER